MNYNGPSRKVKVEIIEASLEQLQKHFPKLENPNTYWLNSRVGQVFEAIIYPELKQAQLYINEKVASVPLEFIKEL